jgi:hypothetical protein
MSVYEHAASLRVRSYVLLYQRLHLAYSFHSVWAGIERTLPRKGSVLRPGGVRTTMRRYFIYERTIAASKKAVMTCNQAGSSIVRISRRPWDVLCRDVTDMREPFIRVCMISRGMDSRGQQKVHHRKNWERARSCSQTGLRVSRLAQEELQLMACCLQPFA